jgi:hypothetical protein
LIVEGHYYPFSSVFFYAHRPGLLWNGRAVNLEYGSYAPDAPPVFIGDSELRRLWSSSERYYVVVPRSTVPRLEGLVGRPALIVVAESGGKLLFTNRPLGSSLPQPGALRGG